MAAHALIFDVDGTLADTEGAHREAFNEAFVEIGLRWQWTDELYTRLLQVSGGHERLAAYWREVEAAPVDEALLERVHAEKTRRYTAKVAGGAVPLRPGIERLLVQASERRLPLAIATTTTAANIGALLGAQLGPTWRRRFVAVADASTAPKKKPHPQAYEQVVAVLRVPASHCLAFEDSHHGLTAARAAGITTVVTPTRYTATDDFAGAAKVWPDLGQVELDELLALVT